MIITLCMIVKNEEEYINMCLENAMKLADEAIIVDTGSIDSTISLIESFGDNIKLLNHKWNNDFSEARNISLEYAIGDLILILDADEKLLCDKEKLLNFIEENKEFDAFTIPLYNILSAEKIVYSDVYCKLFRNMGYRYNGAIHEQITIEKSKLKAIPSDICKIIHYGYLENTKKQNEKAKRNLEISLSDLKKDPNNAFTHYNLGISYSSMGKFNKALDHFLKAHELDRGKIKGYTYYMLKRIAECLYYLKDYKTCIQFLEQVLEDNSLKKFPDLYYTLGETYLSLKDYENSISAFQGAVLAGETKDFISIRGMGSYMPKLMIAKIYTILNYTDEAVKWYVEAIFDPNNFNKSGLDEFKKYLNEHNYRDVLEELNNLL